MKKIKIFAFPSHETKERVSGVDFARIHQPLKYINGYKDDEVSIKVDFYDIHKEKQLNWMEIADTYDVIYLNYTPLDWQYAAMGVCMHGKGKKIIMDIDDAIWYVNPDNIVYNQLQELNAAYKVGCMLSDVDGVSTTNRYLRNIICDKTTKYPEKILVAPNQIDLQLYNKTFPAKDTGEIVLLHYGSSSHFQDLLDTEFINGIDKIFFEYPNVKLKVVHSFISELKYKWGTRYESASGAIDIYDWINNKFPLFMEEADIIVAPLQDNKYNRSKSDIKFIETASAMKPGVFSNTRPYADVIEDGVTGYLAQTSEDWYNKLKQLIESKEKRQEIGNNAYQYVKDNRQIQNNIDPYIDFIKKVVMI